MYPEAKVTAKDLTVKGGVVTVLHSHDLLGIPEDQGDLTITFNKDDAAGQV